MTRGRLLELGVQISGFLPFQVVTGKGGGDMRSGVANKRANIWTYERASKQKPIIINYVMQVFDAMCFVVTCIMDH